MRKRRIVCFFGTRPEAIKMAPVVKALKQSPRYQVSVVVSAQHRGMLDQVLKLFDLKSQVDLNIMKKGQTLSDITQRVIEKLGPVLDRLKPDLVLVHGDTTTTMAGTLSAFYRRIPVGHVEAGLRTRDLFQPYPEEMNRRVTDTMARLYFAPTNESKNHLLSENHPRERIFVTGNTVIDALLDVKKRVKKPHDPRLQKILRDIQAKKDRLILMTAHRRENFGAPFQRICQSVSALAQRFPRVHWIYPVHPNPHVQIPARRFLKNRSNVHLIRPLDYADLVMVMNRSVLVMTDSGGLQEEAPSLGKPVLVFRDVTERPEAIRAGTVQLVGSHSQKIIRSTTRLLQDKRTYQAMANAVNPYGDGQAAQRIRWAINWYFGYTCKKPPVFKKGK